MKNQRKQMKKNNKKTIGNQRKQKKQIKNKNTHRKTTKKQKKTLYIIFTSYIYI